MAVSAIMDIGSDIYNLTKEGIRASTTRAEAISNNMANINTKDYKRFNVVFEENINKNTKNKVKLKLDNEKHISGETMDGNISVERDQSTSMRTDGNNVDLEVEKVNQAANTLKYNALITSVNNRFNNIKYVINGGGN